MPSARISRKAQEQAITLGMPIQHAGPPAARRAPMRAARIGPGPWYNAKGTRSPALLPIWHGDQARDRNNVQKAQFDG